MTSPEHPRILVIGSNGQVGWELVRTLAPLGAVTAVDYPRIDLTNHDSIRQWVRESGARVVVNAAAYTAVDKAETDLDRAMQINAVAPGILAEEARRAGALLVHYSTDYVYDGTKESAYTEEDTTGPVSAYGRSKLAGDVAVQAAGGEHLIFRLCWVYGARGQNFLLTMMRLARERETLRVVADQFGAPTWSRMIAGTTALALARTLASPEPAVFNGVYHLCAGGATSWHGFAQRIIEWMPAEGRRCREVKAIGTADYPLPAKRPANSRLDTAKLRRTFGLSLPDWETSLRLVMEGSEPV
ncbi:MAG: dTDP-4-dehydrorhamnose reductase [Limisphaerales bacterium]